MRTFPSALLVAVGCTALTAGAAQAQTCNKAAFGLSGSSYMDSQLNPPPGEDVEFFSSTGGVPTIFFLVDSSGSMQRLPPNGPGFYGNPLPPLNDIQCPTGGDGYDTGCANRNVPDDDTKKALPNVAGCGLDTVSGAYDGGGFAIGDIVARSFATTCGAALAPAAYLAGYNASYDYAHQASVCPHYQNPNPVSGDDGYDPDFYCTGGGTSCSSHPNFFDKNMVFHEAITDGNRYADNQSGASNCGFNGTDCASSENFDPASPPGNGWNSGAVFPFKKDSSTAGTVDDFCTKYQADITQVATNAGATTTLGGQAVNTLSDLCKTCLNTRGFFFDGYAYRQGQEGVSNVLYASIWLTGNYLNFYPPKHVVARKALKDLLMNNLRIRAGVAEFGGGNCRSAAVMVKALNPACNNVYDSPSNLYSNRAAFMTAINGITFDGGTPLGMALLNVGEQFRSSTLTSWFGAPTNPDSGQTGCVNSAFEPPSSIGNGNQQGLCFPCQSTNIVLITDGRPKPNSGAWPDDRQVPIGSATVTQSNTLYIGNTATGINPGPDAAACPDCSTFGTGKENLNEAIRISWMFHNFDFGDNDANAYACNKLVDKQVLNIYTLGFGTSFTSDAQTLLAKMASVGGGIFASADNPAQLTSAFNDILLNIDTRATSFSVASVNALQATAGQSVIVPRFNPAKSAFWNGHLYRFELYSEFAAGCQAGGTTDLDCDCACNSVFLKDSTGAFISENAAGVFMKNSPNAPTCGPTNHCTGCGSAGANPAVPYWDAAEELNSRSWKERVIYTAIDDSTAPDGKIDSSDPVLALIDPTTQTFLATTISKLQPYMGLTLATGGNCDALSSRLATLGDSVGAYAVSHDLAMCAKAFLAYILGADLLNQNLNTTTTTCRYPPANAGTDADGNYIWNPLALCDRGPPNAPGKLGDIFHSSPVRVLEPEPSSSIFSSYNNQTLASLWITTTPNAVLTASTNRFAYDDYAAAYKTRRRLVVVGANDGLLHAFDAGNHHAGPGSDGDDPALLPSIHTSQPPFNGYYDKGTGDELWAFLPPDLLAKVPLMTGNQHQFFVDGDPMVRDVWVDGTANGMSSATTADDTKQPNEFHTIVVAGERRGGVHYFALDVTDATLKPDETGFQAPRFLWIYPQPNTPRELEMGETYTGFLPVPPPIGPVRLDATTTSPAPTAATPTYVDHAGGTQQVHERWVVFLSGGLDSQYVRGHGVYMLDVWTGQELFSFARPADGDTTYGADDPRWKLDAPIAATVGMMAFGSGARGDTAYPPNGGFFDTATFGDTNGALWTIRFSDPGKIGSNDRVDGHSASNWWGGRSFQFDKSDTGSFCGSTSSRQPFFYITANVPLYSSNRMYRVLAGTGDRYNLLDQYGGTCGPENIRACMLRGCDVTVLAASNKIAVDSLLGTQSTGFATDACTLTTAETMTSGTAGTQCTSIQGRSRVDITGCTSFDTGSLTSTSKTFSTDCSMNAAGGATCTPTTGATQSSGDQLYQSTCLDYSNWFVSVRNYDDEDDRAPFNDLAGAVSYDAARLTQTQTSTTATNLDLIDGSSTSPTTTTADSVGWAMYYNHSAAVTYGGETYNVCKADERSASPSSTPGDSCIYWSTVQPALLDRSAQCPCTVQNTDRFSYFYGANIAGGGLCLKNGTVSGSGTSCTVSNASIRSTGGITLTTPPAPQPTWFINASGQVAVGLTSIQVGTGAQNIGTGLINDAVRQIDWLPVARGNEACRHAGTTAPPASACQQ
jgi:type IV pilus assembly protein PilY1